MKKAFLLALFCVFSLTAQNSPQDLKYRRSSLSMVLIESENFPNKDAVMSSWNNYITKQFPDKYNKHNIDLKSINLGAINLTEQELLDAGFSTDKKIDENDEFKVKIDKVIKERKLANQLVASWFNLKPDGKYDVSVIQDRGSYNASQLDAGIASDQKRQNASLQDAGKELISNTFITFTKLKFVENEPVARAIRDAAKIAATQSLAGKPQFAIDLAMAGIDKVYEKTKEGYSLWSNTWLYKLSWDDKTLYTIYDLLDNPAEFAKSDALSLEFVNFQSNMSLVTFKLGETRTQEQIIDLALVRNVDNAFAKLQKENDVFKPKVPILTDKPVTAQIGMKEGLKGGEKFEVLEYRQDADGVSFYKKVGTVKVNKKQVWDNRYYAGEKPEKEQLDKDGNPVNATLFKGKAPFGALLKQVK
jgi:hypothetical protein